MTMGVTPREKKGAFAKNWKEAFSGSTTTLDRRRGKVTTEGV